VVADLGIFDPPFLAFFFASTNYLSGLPLSECWLRVKRDVLPTYLVELGVWTPIQLLNFRFVNVTYQPVVVNSVNGKCHYYF